MAGDTLVQTPEAATSGVDRCAGGVCGQLHAGLDLLDHELDALARARGVTSHDLAAVLRELTRLVNRTQALRDKGAAIASAARADEAGGARTPAAWVAGVTGTDPRTAHRQARRVEALGEGLLGTDLSDTTEVGGDMAGGSAPDGPASDGSGVGGEGAGGPTGPSGPSDTDPAEAATSPRAGLSLVARAQLAGDLSPEQVDVITGVMGDLPDGTGAEVRARCEVELVRLARGRAPRDLRRLAARVLERVTGDTAAADTHESTVVTREEDAAWERCSFWIKDNDDGTMFGQFTVPTVPGLVLKKVLDAMSSPRRRTPARDSGNDCDRSTGVDGRRGVDGSTGRASSGANDGAEPSWYDPSMTWKDRRLARMRRQGQDLATLLTHLPTDHLHEKTAATLVVTTRLHDLQKGAAGTGQSGPSTPQRGATGSGSPGAESSVPNLQAPGSNGTRSGGPRVGASDTGHPVSAGQLRQLACAAGIIPAVLGTDGQPLDLGRQTRFFTSTQRAALATRYDTCAIGGCDVPFAWSEIHHLAAWRSGGRTDLDNAVPLCGHHHRLLDRGYHAQISRDGPRRRLTLVRDRR
ncbi:hypothetical protein GCM10027055_00910 [Janibacter alkaliphilus]|uniref:HNH nuclease domain-containing protein n=1 Tax=Janibacter alkaliphilus TaxID=1069963 RepID=A0A852XDZ8_9MICO|nr:HNH endonuclease signature motif containing protein [Janibacter alkaliphilus]NYG36705.1 hypothetical protein [Janibacter alkaliphilus]